MACLRKWYFDCLTPENDYLFVYYASVRMAALVFRTVTVHLARAAKGVVLTRALAIPRRADDSALPDGHILRMDNREIRIHAGGFTFRLADGDCSLRLDYAVAEPRDFEPVAIPTGRKSWVRWKPLGLKYQVSGQVRIAGEQVVICAADGYADYLEADCFPRAFPVRRLYWGRLTHPEIDLVYMRAQDGTGEHAWSGMYGRAREVSFESHSVEIIGVATSPASNPASTLPAGYAVSATNGADQISVTVRHEVPVQTGGFIDQQNSMSALTRWLLKTFTRNPQSTKCLSRADVAGELRGVRLTQRGVAFIDEHVTF